eukprot:6212931-Pleurochrysis_carterae.AAC.2
MARQSGERKFLSDGSRLLMGSCVGRRRVGRWQVCRCMHPAVAWLPAKKRLHELLVDYTPKPVDPSRRLWLAKQTLRQVERQVGARRLVWRQIARRAILRGKMLGGWLPMWCDGLGKGLVGWGLVVVGRQEC